MHAAGAVHVHAAAQAELGGGQRLAVLPLQQSVPSLRLTDPEQLQLKAEAERQLRYVTSGQVRTQRNRRLSLLRLLLTVTVSTAAPPPPHPPRASASLCVCVDTLDFALSLSETLCSLCRLTCSNLSDNCVDQHDSGSLETP